MPRRWRALGSRTPCIRCGRDAIGGSRLCYIDVLFLARLATNAHEAVSAADRGLKGRERTEAALAYLEAGHGAHREPHEGCWLCVVRG